MHALGQERTIVTESKARVCLVYRHAFGAGRLAGPQNFDGEDAPFLIDYLAGGRYQSAVFPEAGQSGGIDPDNYNRRAYVFDRRAYSLDRRAYAAPLAQNFLNLNRF